MRHGRATMPWGKYKNVRIRLIPDDYLSFLTELPMMKQKQWKWLKDSLDSELRFRGLRADLADTTSDLFSEQEFPQGVRRSIQVE